VLFCKKEALPYRASFSAKRLALEILPHPQPEIPARITRHEAPHAAEVSIGQIAGIMLLRDVLDEPGLPPGFYGWTLVERLLSRKKEAKNFCQLVTYLIGKSLLLLFLQKRRPS
jgi:hypothetical protein